MSSLEESDPDYDIFKVIENAKDGADYLTLIYREYDAHTLLLRAYKKALQKLNDKELVIGLLRSKICYLSWTLRIKYHSQWLRKHKVPMA